MITSIITTYNSENYIERSLISVKNQTFKSPTNEIILVDDGSKDNTLKIARKILPDLKIIEKKNSGPASSRNIGIKKSKNELIAFLDADDYWHLDKLKYQAEDYKLHNDFDIFVCNTKSIHGDEILGLRFDKSKILENSNLEVGEVKNYLKKKGRYSFHPPSSILVKKKIFYELGFYNENLISVEDSEIFLRWVLSNKKILFNSKPLMYYETANNNSLTKNLTLWSKNHFYYWYSIDISKIDKNKKIIFKIMRKKTLLDSIFTIIKRGQNFLAIKLLFKNFIKLVSLKYFFILILTLVPLSLIKKYYDYFFTKNSK